MLSEATRKASIVIGILRPMPVIWLTSVRWWAV